jgi:hypothetical protein
MVVNATFVSRAPDDDESRAWTAVTHESRAIWWTRRGASTDRGTMAR